MEKSLSSQLIEMKYTEIGLYKIGDRFPLLSNRIFDTKDLPLPHDDNVSSPKPLVTICVYLFFCFLLAHVHLSSPICVICVPCLYFFT